MVCLFFLMTALAALDTVCEIVAAIVRRVNCPRCRWNRGGRYSFN